jgi:hypothetical protein
MNSNGHESYQLPRVRKNAEGKLQVGKGASGSHILPSTKTSSAPPLSLVTALPDIQDSTLPGFV